MNRFTFALKAIALAFVLAWAGHVGVHAQGQLPAYSLWGNPTGSTALPRVVTNEVLNAKDFGAVCDGSTNDATAFQNLINAAIATGRAARFVGECRINTGLTISSSIDFGGMSPGMGLSVAQGQGSFTTGSLLRFPSGIDGITVSTPKPVYLHDFAMMPVQGQSGQKAIVVTDGSYVNQGSYLNNLYVQAFETCIHFVAAANWVLANSNTVACSTTSLRIQDTYNVDAGDSTVFGNTFNGMSGVPTITYESSGGLRFVNNKINGGSNCFLLNLVAGAATGILAINDNSIEGCAASAVRMTRQSTTGTFVYTSITGNMLRGAVAGINIPLDATGPWLSNVSIVGNTIISDAAGVIVHSTDGFTIDGNTFNATTNGVVAITTGASASNGQIGLNPKTGSTYGSDSFSSSTTSKTASFTTAQTWTAAQTFSSGITVSSGFTATGLVDYADIQNLGALSVMGRSANSSGVGADISATAASGAVLRESGNTIGFGTIATAGIANNAVTLAKLATQATNTVLGNATSGTAEPTALAVASCSTTASALKWTTNTGFGCNTFGTAALLNSGSSGGTVPIQNATFNFSVATAGIARYSIRNTDSGASSYTALDYGNDSSAVDAEFLLTSSGNSNYGGARSFNVLTNVGPISFYAGGVNFVRNHASGGFSINTTSDPGAGMIYTNSASFMMRTKTSYSNGAGAGAGTISNAPSAGNPTKWIPVDDNGTTRYVPAW